MQKHDLYKNARQLIEEALEVKDELKPSDDFVASIVGAAIAIKKYVSAHENNQRRLNIIRLTKQTLRSLLAGKFVTKSYGSLSTTSRSFKAVEAVLIEIYGLLLIHNPFEDTEFMLINLTRTQELNWAWRASLKDVVAMLPTDTEEIPDEFELRLEEDCDD